MIGKFTCRASCPEFGRYWQFNVCEDGFWFKALFERSENDRATWVRVK